MTAKAHQGAWSLPPDLDSRHWYHEDAFPGYEADFFWIMVFFFVFWSRGTLASQRARLLDLMIRFGDRILCDFKCHGMQVDTVGGAVVSRYMIFYRGLQSDLAC